VIPAPPGDRDREARRRLDRDHHDVLWADLARGLLRHHGDGGSLPDGMPVGAESGCGHRLRFQHLGVEAAKLGAHQLQSLERAGGKFPRVHQERFRTELAQRDTGAACQRVPSAYQDRQPAPPDDFPFHPRERGKDRHLMNESHVQAAVAHLGQQPLAHGSGTVEHDARVFRVEGGEHRRDHLLGQQDHPGAQHPGPAPADTANPLQSTFHVRQQVPGIVQELSAGVGELHTLAGTFE